MNNTVASFAFITYLFPIAALADVAADAVAIIHGAVDGTSMPENSAYHASVLARASDNPYTLRSRLKVKAPTGISDEHDARISAFVTDKCQVTIEVVITARDQEVFREDAVFDFTKLTGLAKPRSTPNEPTLDLEIKDGFCVSSSSQSGTFCTGDSAWIYHQSPLPIPQAEAAIANIQKACAN
ncbi:hypothetical protein GJW-30_1_03025 [Variibacter gotjawalensis]|uniref:Uncharacterized protein n=1 Tax=Variibacter gotjawalensis TaxID=1333996 RepID=A0A0S3PX28_9BRAD|nr:hypothetical protein [Variibacter gotjawalensis]NIK46309.1 hypothetical protein [Variibacter gotjawalensis]RZS48224.1 hypothetical protein EV661_0628 [Variibacter gotjawalensis]BAT60481.1 hypothetical protein GJW-30_1_03025 [Variibacter gotjawalensis]